VELHPTQRYWEELVLINKVVKEMTVLGGQGVRERKEKMGPEKSMGKWNTRGTEDVRMEKKTSSEVA